jgi:hypothetical protein
MKVRLLVCGLCVSEGVPPEERFRASDSERGKRSIGEHIIDDHAAVAVNELLLGVSGVDPNAPNVRTQGR